MNLNPTGCCIVPLRGKLPPQNVKPTRKWQVLQFLPHPLGAGSKKEQISIDSHVKKVNFTAKLYLMTTLLHDNSEGVNVFPTCTIVWSGEYFFQVGKKNGAPI